MAADDRVWVIEPPIEVDGETGEQYQRTEIDANHLAAELTELSPILVRLGGVVNLAAIREKVGEPDLYVTRKVIATWKPHIPGLSVEEKERRRLEAEAAVAAAAGDGEVEPQGELEPAPAG